MSQWWPSQFQPKTISSTLANKFLFATNVIKHILFTKNPFAFEENRLTSAHQKNDIIGHKLFCTEWFWSPCRILVISMVYFCLIPFLRKKNGTLAMHFYVCFQNSDIIIGHVITEVSVAIRVNELHIFSKFGHVLSRKKVTETCFCFLVVP